jgi:hypothetical protein
MVLEADLRRSLDWETVQPEKRQFVPVAPLKGNPAVSDGEEAAASQAQGIAPFEDCDIAGFVDDFGNASHFSSGKVSLEHLANCRAALNGFACHLMVHSVFVIEFRNGSSVAFVETSDELFNHFAGAHQLPQDRKILDARGFAVIMLTILLLALGGDWLAWLLQLTRGWH